MGSEMCIRDSMYTYIRNDSVCRASCAAVQKMLAGDVDAKQAVKVFNNNYNAVKEKSPVITTFDREYQWRVSDTGSEAFSVRVNTLREICNVDMLIAPGEGYIPTYTRTDITDALHDAFGFRTDYQITSQKNMRKILNQTKKK